MKDRHCGSCASFRGTDNGRCYVNSRFGHSEVYLPFKRKTDVACEKWKNRRLLIARMKRRLERERSQTGS